MAFLRKVLGVAVLGSATMMSSSLLSGCGNFFQCEGKADCGTGTTTGTTSSDVVYVSDGPSGNTYLSAYTITSGTLATVSGTGDSYDLGYVPVAMVVAPSNEFLYVASRADAPISGGGAGVYVYSIGSTGALTAANGGKPFFTDQGIASMDISADGNYLYTVGTSTTAGAILNQYSIDKTTGLATNDTPSTLITEGTTCAIVTAKTPLSQQCTVKVSPNEDYVAVALGSYGFEVYPYTSSGGVTNTPQLSPSPSDQSADFSLAWDKNNNLYVASTVALTPFTGIGGTGAPVAGTPITYGGTETPRSVTVSANSGFVYTADEGEAEISGFSVTTSGVLTALPAPFIGPTDISALGVDSTGAYMVAAGISSNNGLELFNITSTGDLTSAGITFPTGTDTTVPMVIALSH
jgi:6-phosphogluconolactonase